MNADWNDLRVFLTLAREGSLTAAARRLEVSHPTVARRIKALEESFGARLFDRLPDKFALTSAGEGLLEDATAMERAAESLQRRSAGLGDTVHGTVRLSAGEAMAAFIARHLPRLRHQAAMHRDRADGEPHAGQSLPPRGRSPDPRAGARSRQHRHPPARPRGLCGLWRRRRCAGATSPASSSAAWPGSASTTTTITCRGRAGSSTCWTARGPRSG